MKKHILQATACFCAVSMMLSGCGAKDTAETVDLREVSL